MRNNNSRRSITLLIQGLLLMAFTPFAAAYIGPGSGISVIGSLLALLATIGLAFLAIVMFPIRKMMKKRGAQEDAEESDEEDVAVAKEKAEQP